MIIGLINLGHALEQRARQRSSKTLERLLDLTPAQARLVSEQGEMLVPLSAVQPGMTLMRSSVPAALTRWYLIRPVR